MGASMSGAMDANAFTHCDLSDHARLPPPESISWEGVLHEHYFQTGSTNKRVEPQFSLVSLPDPLSGNEEAWLVMGLNSCYDGRGLQEKGRLPCNAVFVVDVSGSMGSPFSGDAKPLKKIDAAKEALIGMMPLFHADDAVAILAFDTQCTVEAPLVPLREKNAKEHLKDAALSLNTRGGTNFMAGFDCAMNLIQEAEGGLLTAPVAWTPRINNELPPASRNSVHFLRQILWKGARLRHGCIDQVLSFLSVCDVTACGSSEIPANVSRKAFTETRIFFMTDMNINQGTKDGSELMLAVENAAKKQGIMTTIIGIGVDFDVALTDRLACVRGANYFTAHSTDEFLRQMTEELDYLMAPLAFDMKVEMDLDRAAIPVVAEHVYGAPEPAKNGPRPAGTLARINSFFPSSTDQNGQTKGSLILSKLDQAPPSGHLRLTTTYNPRTGGSVQQMNHQAQLTRSVDATTLKGIALIRYVNVVRCYLADMRDGAHMPSSSPTTGIVHPPNKNAGTNTLIPGGGYPNGSALMMQKTNKKEANIDLEYQQQQRARRMLAASYSETFKSLEQYLDDVEIQLKSWGDGDSDMSKWREKLVELGEGCAECMKSSDAEELEAQNL